MEFPETVFQTRELMPCLFLRIYFPRNYFPHFSMFDRHLENWSKKSEFRSEEKISLHASKVFSFFYSKENTFLFSKHAPTRNDCKGLIWWGQRLLQLMLLLSANVFYLLFLWVNQNSGQRKVNRTFNPCCRYGKFMWPPLKTFFFV